MSYESRMLAELQMPSKKDVQEALLIALFNHDGTIKEFGAKEDMVEEIASQFQLNEQQRNAQLETIYRKENRVKRVSLWHRLLFRAADELANHRLVLRPSETYNLTSQREWMLTEKGYDRALVLLHVPFEAKSFLSVKSYEVEAIAKQILQSPRPKNYVPVEEKKLITQTREVSIRFRGFRQAIIEAYDYRCAVCGLKLYSPDRKIWEVQAAHIVPHSAKGKDDILNGIALCRVHHWAFDMGWFSFQDNYALLVSSQWQALPEHFGRMGDYSLLSEKRAKIYLPSNPEMYPHPNSLEWHRNKIFCKHI